MTEQQPELELELPPEFADCGSLHLRTLARLRLELLIAARATASPVPTVGMTNVRCGGAAFIGVLLETNHHLRRTGRRLKLRDVRPEILEILEICRLTKRFVS